MQASPRDVSDSEADVVNEAQNAIQVLSGTGPGKQEGPSELAERKASTAKVSKSKHAKKKDSFWTVWTVKVPFENGESLNMQRATACLGCQAKAAGMAWLEA